ncbi:MAG TPA: MFS transporter [Rhizomicrobium sp.]|jgi:MFS family permease
MAVAESVVLAPPRSAIASRLVLLLAIGLFINYVDRGNLATASPLIKDELHLSNVQLGLLTSAFFWTYTPAQLLSSWLAEKVGPFRVLAAGFALWSIATILTGFAGGFASLIVLRIFLGLGESAGFPCSSKLLADHLPPHQLGTANGFIVAGVALGPAFGTLVGGLLMASYGWRAMFLVFGTVALIWLWPWLSVTRSAPRAVDTQAAQPPPAYSAILSLREMWGCLLGHFSLNYFLYFVLSWLPLYLVKERGFSIAEMAQFGALIYALHGISSITIGWLSDRWVAAGGSITGVRKAVAVASHLVGAVALVVTVLGGPVVSMAALLVAGACLGACGSSFWAITQTLAGPRAAARWVGVQNGVANFAGIVAPLITGVIADRTGSFTGAFFFAAAVAVIGAAGWGLVIRRVEPVRWSA